jgi:hypothetical protein
MLARVSKMKIITCSARERENFRRKEEGGRRKGDPDFTSSTFQSSSRASSASLSISSATHISPAQVFSCSDGSLIS